MNPILIESARPRNVGGMRDIDFKTDNAADLIAKALDNFLRDKKLQLTGQQYDRLKKLLMVRLLDEEMSYASAYNTLSDTIEYRKDYDIDANAPDEAEEEMIRIIGAADTKETEIVVETTKFKKRFLIALGLLVLLCTMIIGTKAAGYYLSKQAEMAAVITTTEEEQIKQLVQKVVDLETSRGNEITPNAVYNKIKNLETVQAHGPATSYKKFNRAQLNETITFLNQWISKTQYQEKKP